MKKTLLMLAAAAALLAACKPSTPDDPDNPGNDPQENNAPIVIDGVFDDWAALDAAKVAVAKNTPNSPWTYARSMRVYADASHIYYFIEFDKQELAELMEEVKGDKGLPMRVNLNIDGEFTTGYTNYSLDGYDYIIEGSLAENGKWTSFDGTLHEWGWREAKSDYGWNEVLAYGSGLTWGAGEGNKYELAVDRKVFNRVEKLAEPKKIPDTFQTGLRFYTPSWGEMANLPNASVSDHEQGWAHLLEIKTNK